METAATADTSGRAIARRLALEVYLPLSLCQLGRGMLLPIVPLYLRETGLSYILVTVVISALGLGAILGSVPVGSLSARLGPEPLFVVGAIVMAVTSALLGVSTAVLALVAFRLAYGMGAVGLRVAAQMIVNAAVPVHLRGRAMSVIGGTVRLAFFLGPLLGGVLVDAIGFEATFVVCGVATLAGMVPFFVVRGGSLRAGGAGRPPVSSGWRGLGPHRRLLLMAGIGGALVMAVREGRNVVVPLIGEDLGLSATAVGALVAIGTGADLLLFPVAGWLMDRFGRLAAIVPAFSLLGIGMLVLGLGYSTAGAIAAGVIMGVGNGMSAGTMLTLGGDLAPAESGPFLAALGAMLDGGVVLGPILVGWLADAISLASAAVLLGVVMFVAVAYIVIVLGDTADPRRPWLVSQLEASPAGPPAGPSTDPSTGPSSGVSDRRA